MSSGRAVFDSLPSGLDIAHWFADQGHKFQNPGGDATLLSDDPHCTMWFLAFVDHDEQEFYLLNITTDEKDDLLFVTAGVDGISCQWRNEGDPTEQPWTREGLEWFAKIIQVHIEAVEYEQGRL